MLNNIKILAYMIKLCKWFSIGLHDKVQSLAFRGLHSLVLVTVLVLAPTNRRPRGRNTLVLYCSPAHHSPAILPIGWTQGASVYE